MGGVGMSIKEYQIINPVLKGRVHELVNRSIQLNEILRYIIKQQQRVREILFKLYYEFFDISNVGGKGREVDIAVKYMEEIDLQYDFCPSDFVHVEKMLNYMLSTLDKRKRLMTTYSEVLSIIYGTAEKILGHIEINDARQKLMIYGKLLFQQGKELMEQDSSALLEKEGYKMQRWQQEKLIFQLETAKKTKENVERLIES